MPLSIATNLASMTAQRSFLNSNTELETAFERLSTGKRVNSAVDDAAGLAIGKDLESRVSGLNQAIRNVNDGISMVQIAEGALDEVTTILQRMRDISVQAANGSLSTVEQGYLDTEQSKLAESLGKALDQAKFNDTDLVKDALVTNVTIQSGANEGDITALTIGGLSEEALGVSAAAINLAGTTSTAETVSFADFRAASMVAGTASMDSTTLTLASGSTGVYTVEIDGTSFSTSTISPPDSVAGLATALNAATDANGTAATALGTFSEDPSAAGDLLFTAAAGGAMTEASITLISTGFTTDFDDGSSAAVAFDNAGTDGVDGTTVANDTYTLTVGSNTYTTDAAGATTDYKTNKQIATALQSALTDAQVTDFTIATVGDLANSAITITYATNGDKSETVYKLEKSYGTAGTDVDNDTTTAAITEGTSKASDAITAIDTALATVASERASLGATQSQLESTVRNLANVAENTSSAAGRIMDTDYAAETANLTKAQILQQAATSILAQANAQPQAVLSLLQ